MSNDLSQEVSPVLQMRLHKLARPVEAQCVGRNDHDQSEDHDHAEAQSSACEPDKGIAAFPETLEHYTPHSRKNARPSTSSPRTGLPRKTVRGEPPSPLLRTGSVEPRTYLSRCFISGYSARAAAGVLVQPQYSPER